MPINREPKDSIIDKMCAIGTLGSAAIAITWLIMFMRLDGALADGEKLKGAYPDCVDPRNDFLLESDCARPECIELCDKMDDLEADFIDSFTKLSTYRGIAMASSVFLMVAACGISRINDISACGRDSNFSLFSDPKAGCNDCGNPQADSASGGPSML